MVPSEWNPGKQILIEWWTLWYIPLKTKYLPATSQKGVSLVQKVTELVALSLSYFDLG